MSVISRSEVGTEQAANLALVRELIGEGRPLSFGFGNYSDELRRLDHAVADIQQDILFMVADGDAVMTRFRISGTIRGNGTGVTSTGLMVHRVVDGRVVEAWI